MDADYLEGFLDLETTVTYFVFLQLLLITVLFHGFCLLIFTTVAIVISLAIYQLSVSLKFANEAEQ